MNEISFITSNKGKFNEALKKFENISVKIVQRNLGYIEIQTDKLEDVAIYGASQIESRFNETFFLEDSGLFIETLNGFPGVYSSYIYHTVGCKGILEILKDEKIRNSYFKSVIAYKEPNKKAMIFTGVCQGTIAYEQIGDNGFGYDPIFIPSGEKRTFGQMGTFEKNKYSHRGKSFDQLLTFLKNKI